MKTQMKGNRRVREGKGIHEMKAEETNGRAEGDQEDKRAQGRVEVGKNTMTHYV